MNASPCKITSFVAGVVLLATSVATPGDKNGQLSPASQSGQPAWTVFNINSLSAWTRDNLFLGRNPISGNAGTIYPRGTTGVVFQDGLVWCAWVHDTRDTSLPQLRAGGATYESGVRPGWITVPGTPTTPPVAIDPSEPRARVYRIRQDYQALTPENLDVIEDAAELNNVPVGDVTGQMAQDVIDHYALDWSEWPGDLGAPYTDVNHNGTWDPGIDTPGLQDADQVIWFVCNDVDSATTARFAGAPPIGLELQVTTWGYKANGPHGQTAYRRFRLINKSGFMLDSMYVGNWSDPDVGGAGDDFAGCDTTLDAAFSYNGSPIDNLFVTYGLPPPSIGYSLLQGPVVVTGNPADTALFDFRKIPGAANKRMTSAIYAAAGGAYVFFPPYGDPDASRQWRNLLNGRFPIGGVPFIYPGIGGPTTFWLDGDPIAATGRIDGYIDQPGDRQIMLCSGGYSMANGDTQEAVIALTGGILPTGNHLASVTEMKDNIRSLRAQYGRVMSPPKVSATTSHPSSTTTQLNVRVDMRSFSGVSGGVVSFTPEVGQEQPILLLLYDDGTHNDSLAGDDIWGNSTTVTNRKYPYRGDLTFTSAAGQLHYPAIYDNVALRPKTAVSSVRVIWENGRQDSSINNSEQVHLGFDLHNIDMSHSVDSIFIRNLSHGGGEQWIRIFTPLSPGGSLSGDSLYLIVTAPAQGDSALVRFELRYDHNTALVAFHLPIVQWTPGAHWGDTLEVTRIHGVPYNVKPVIADPLQLTGHNYLMTFFHGSTDLRWRLRDQTTGQLKLDNGVITADPNHPFPVIDGVQYRVIDGSMHHGMYDFQTVANAAGPLIPPEGAAATFAGFPAVGDPTARQQVGPARWLIHTGAAGIFGDVSYQHFLLRVLRSDNPSRFNPSDYEIRFTPAGGRAWLAYTSEAVIDVAFELWNVGVDTPDDPSDDYRLIPWLNDADNNNQFALDDLDHPISGGDDDPETDWAYFYKPYDTTAGQSGYQNEFVNRGSSYDGSDGNGHFHEEIMARIVFVNWNGGTIPGPYNQTLPEQGTIFRIISTKPNFAGDSLQMVATPASVPGSGVPSSFYLDQNYPNPFNPATTIRFGLKQRGNVRLEVYNILGQRVRSLINADVEAGDHTVVWDGRNDSGARVGSGVYFYRLTTNHFMSARKMILVK